MCSDPPRLAFYFNAALLSIHMNKPDQCKEVRSVSAAPWPQPSAYSADRACTYARAYAPPQACAYASPCPHP